jgi:hypothetical protein
VTAYLDYGGANQVTFDVEHTTQHYAARKNIPYPAGTDNGIFEYDAKADRVWELVNSGPISLTELGRIKTLTESSSACNFRCAITNNADVTVTILEYHATYGSEISSDKIWVRMVVREVI